MNKVSTQETIRVLYFNARSIVKKVDEISSITRELNPDIVIVTETWCHSGISNSFLNIPGYTIDKIGKTLQMDVEEEFWFTQKQIL